MFIYQYILIVVAILALASFIFLISLYSYKKQWARTPAIVLSIALAVIVFFLSIGLLPEGSPLKRQIAPPRLVITDDIKVSETSSSYSIMITVKNTGESSAGNPAATAIINDISYHPVINVNQLNAGDSAYIGLIRAENRHDKWLTWVYDESVRAALAQGKPPLEAWALPQGEYDLKLNVSCSEIGVQDTSIYKLTISELNPPLLEIME
jgi:hypothetical protein